MCVGIAKEYYGIPDIDIMDELCIEWEDEVRKRHRDYLVLDQEYQYKYKRIEKFSFRDYKDSNIPQGLKHIAALKAWGIKRDQVMLMLDRYFENKGYNPISEKIINQITEI